MHEKGQPVGTRPVGWRGLWSLAPGIECSEHGNRAPRRCSPLEDGYVFGWGRFKSRACRSVVMDIKTSVESSGVNRIKEKEREFQKLAEPVQPNRLKGSARGLRYKRSSPLFSVVWLLRRAKRRTRRRGLQVISSRFSFIPPSKSLIYYMI